MNPNDEFYARTRSLIDKFGRSILFVGGDPRPFGYTIGNAEKGLPELLMVGIGPETTMAVLNAISDQMFERGRAFDDLEQVDIGAAVKSTVVDADDKVKEDFTVQVARALEIEPSACRVQQVVIPDEQGRLPWNADCAEPYRSLPVYRKGGVQ